MQRNSEYLKTQHEYFGFGLKNRRLIFLVFEKNMALYDLRLMKERNPIFQHLSSYAMHCNGE